jgi:hypothetical protein
MKHIILLFLIIASMDLPAQKPILPDFNADPSARVFGNRYGFIHRTIFNTIPMNDQTNNNVEIN